MIKKLFKQINEFVFRKVLNSHFQVIFGAQNLVNEDCFGELCLWVLWLLYTFKDINWLCPVQKLCSFKKDFVVGSPSLRYVLSMLTFLLCSIFLVLKFWTGRSITNSYTPLYNNGIKYKIIDWKIWENEPIWLTTEQPHFHHRYK